MSEKCFLTFPLTPKWSGILQTLEVCLISFGHYALNSFVSTVIN